MAIRLAHPGITPKVFFRACELAEIKPTRRQFSKWKREIGTAFKYRNQALTEQFVVKAQIA